MCRLKWKGASCAPADFAALRQSASLDPSIRKGNHGEGGLLPEENAHLDVGLCSGREDVSPEEKNILSDLSFCFDLLISCLSLSQNRPQRKDVQYPAERHSQSQGDL